MKKRKSETPQPKPVPIAFGWESVQTATVADVAALLREIAAALRMEGYEAKHSGYLMGLLVKGMFLTNRLDPAPRGVSGRWRPDAENKVEAEQSHHLRAAKALLEQVANLSDAPARVRPLLAARLARDDIPARLLVIADSLNGGNAQDGAAAAHGGAERDLGVETNEAKDAEARGVEAFAGFLGRVLNHAEDLAGELRPALRPTYPIDINLVKRNCQVLRRLLDPITSDADLLDLDALSGFGVEPKTLLSFFRTNFPSRDSRRAAKWLLNLAERIDRDVTTEQRPTGELVRQLEEAAALLRGSKSRAEVARDLIEAIDDLVSYVKDHHSQHLNYFGEVKEQLHPRGVRVQELASALDLASRERPVYNTYGEVVRDDSECAVVRIHLMRNPTWPGWAVKEDDRPWHFCVMPVDGHPWYEEMAALRLKAEVILAEEQERGQSRSKAKKKTKGRMKREVAEALILDHLKRRPHDTAKEIGEAVGCSVGVVGESSAWKMNRTRLKIAKKEGKDPKAVKLSLKAVNEAGGSLQAQQHEAKRRQQALDNEIDQRDRELLRQIGEYQKEHPDATYQEVAQAVGCSAGEVERREAMQNRLVAEQDASAKEDAGGRLPDEAEPGVDLKRPRQWVRERP